MDRGPLVRTGKVAFFISYSHPVGQKATTCRAEQGVMGKGVEGVSMAF
jgi:hypothetical protein